jgi:hypothetical protein
VCNENYEDDLERRKIGVKGNNAKISAGTPAIPTEIVVIILNPSMLMPAQDHKRGHDRFLSQYFQPIFN